MPRPIPEVFQNCRTREERVACVASAMIRLTDGNMSAGCTGDQIKAYLCITDNDLAPLVEDARAKAMADSCREGRARRAA